MASENRISSKTKIEFGAFIALSIAVSVILGVFLSPFASDSPDGLERVAEDKGFLEKAEEAVPAWKHSPIPDYTFPGVKNEKVATGLSGLIGVLITLAVSLAIGSVPLIIRKLISRSGRIVQG